MLGIKEKIQLTNNQKKAVDLVNDFVNSINDIFILTGAAGTGKTTVIRNVIDKVNPVVSNIILLAPTNRAAKVLSKKTGILAGTIHSEIYIVKEIKDKDGNLIETRLIPRHSEILFDEDETDQLKSQNNLFIIDESSMISASPNTEGALISDNSLLEDLLLHVRKYSSNNKILFVGDTYQLPPIGYTGVAPALRKDFLEENFTVKISEYALTEVLRQEQDSPILIIAGDIKNKIDSNHSSYSLNLQDKFEGYNSFIKNYTRLFNPTNFDDTIALGWSRKNVLKMNIDIRSTLFGGSPNVFEVGDVLYLNSKFVTKTLSVPKGEIGKVIAVIKNDGIKGGMLFHTLKIEFRDFSNTPYIIESKVLSDYAYSDVDFIPKSMFINLAIERSSENETFKKTGESIDDEYMSAMQVKFAYALTVHKSQGGEWNNVFLHASTNWRDLRWNYTAVTRASKNIYSYYL